MALACVYSDCLILGLCVCSKFCRSHANRTLADVVRELNTTKPRRPPANPINHDRCPRPSILSFS